MPEFVFHRIISSQSLGDFQAQQLAITLAQTVHGHFDRAFGQVHLGGEFGVGLGLAFADQAAMQAGEDFPPAGGLILLAQAAQDGVK